MKRSSVWQRVASLSLVGVAICSLVYLIRREGASQVLGAVTSARWFVLFAVPLCALWNVLAVLSWHGILRSIWPTRVNSIAWLLLSRFAAQSVNSLVPTFGLGGEALRSGAARNGGVPMAVSVVATAVDNIAGVIGGLLFTSIVLGIEIYRLPTLHAASYVILEAALFVVTSVALWQSRRVLWWMTKFWKNTSVIAVRQYIATPRFARALYKAVLWRACERLLWAGELWLGFFASGQSVALCDASLLVGGLFLVSLVFFIIPSQWGAAEGVMVMLGRLLGIAPSAMLAVALLRRGRQLLTSVLALPAVPWVTRVATRSANGGREGGPPGAPIGEGAACTSSI